MNIDTSLFPTVKYAAVDLRKCKVDVRIEGSGRGRPKKYRTIMDDKNGTTKKRNRRMHCWLKWLR